MQVDKFVFLPRHVSWFEAGSGDGGAKRQNDLTACSLWALSGQLPVSYHLLLVDEVQRYVTCHLHFMEIFLFFFFSTHCVYSQSFSSFLVVYGSFMQWAAEI